ncbi:MAG TPA: hypothetical protein VFQ80_14185 [Thermomicrobiales bacterium]|jgi:hypothetical protein|nr:hypothetical protein [Thermomicrobiales bacterium]
MRGRLAMAWSRRWLLGRLPARLAAPAAVAVAWQAVHLDVVFVPEHPVSITAAGGGPPQRGDWFYIDAPIYRLGDVGGASIGVYQCFGAWTAAATANDAPSQRLTSVQFHLADGMLMGLINEGGPEDNAPNVFGAILGGTGAYAGARGAFNQFNIAPKGGTAGTISTAGGTPTPVASVVHSTIDLLVPVRS